jgi:hypothetical protein
LQLDRRDNDKYLAEVTLSNGARIFRCYRGCSFEVLGGLLTLRHAFAYVRTDPDLAVIAAVMRATDKPLFAMVLVIFGCAISLGFLSIYRLSGAQHCPAG